MFKYTLDNKRYHTLNYHVKNKYKTKVVKISLNAGFTCPNLDGTRGYGGCIYCSKLGSGDFGGDVNKSLKEQFFDIKGKIDKKWPNSKYIAYFQARTNTYAPVEVLKEKFDSVLDIDGVIGIAIATRADAISDECLSYLEKLNNRTNLTIELGLQTIHDSTSRLINRGHTLKEFEDTYHRLKERNIEVVVHIINGLPNETEEMMLDTVRYLNKLKIDGIKIHMLNIIKDTKMADLYMSNSFHLLTKDEYIDIVIKQLELLNPEVVIHRITSDPDPKDLIEPKWLIKKFCLLNDIDKEMKRRDTFQGSKTNSIL
ncbi:MAG: TIGR01212 family radical SAM protein [Bacilli bacterium]|nr:TIGR01212 family radical SAM protein [Bacilli bacterium]